MSPQLVNKIKLQLRGKSNGSAITEFLIFTLPFFAALILITLNAYQHSMATNEAKNLARQSLRAFITSPNNEIAEARADQVLEIYRDNLSAHDFNNRNFEIKFECSNNPCLSPGGSVTAYLRVSIKGRNFKDISANTTEYVDLWR